MIRKLILLVALLALVGACSSSPSGESAVASTPPTASPTATPEPEPSEPPASSGSESAVLDLLPDQIGGLDHTDIDFADSPFIASALAGTGIDPAGVEYIVRTWGEGDVTLSAMRIAGMQEMQLQMLARAMAGAGSEGVSTETVTVGGKSVLQINGEDAPAAAYMYFAEGTMFTVVSESLDLATEVLTALP